MVARILLVAAGSLITVAGIVFIALIGLALIALALRRRPFR